LSVVAASVLGACGGGSGGSDDEAKAPPTNAACTLVTKEDATTLFGVEADASDNASPGDEASVCMWEADDGDNHSYLLQVRVYDDEYHYGGEIFPTAEEISGLGDKAFVNKGESIAGTDVQFVQGGKTYTVNYGISNVMAKVKKSAADQADELVAIIRANSSKV
jgi:hypothetical protein